jgi:glyoxylate reductase
MPYPILTNRILPDSTLAMLEDECAIQLWTGSDTDPALLQAALGLYIYGHPHIDGPVMDSMPNLRVITNMGVGVDHIDLAAARDRGIAVGNTPGLVDGATADLTMALLLAIARNLVTGDRYAHSASFTAYDPEMLHGHDVHGATLGIVGLGRIGSQVARRAQGFDMNILYHNRNRNQEAESELGVAYRGLPDLLAESDFVSINVPLGPETRGLIGQAELALMKPSAYLINIARGGVLDHDALYDALQNDRIAGAAVDVTEPEPLPRDHMLLTVKNLIITPHLGSATVETRQNMARRAVDNLLAGLRGEPLPSRIA